MDRRFYLDLAKRGRAFPIGADLVLKEDPDHQAVLCDGSRLGKVIIDTARRYGAPLALPLMDLTLEKELLLGRLGIAPTQAAGYHFDQCPAPDILARAREGDLSANPRLRATLQAIAHVRQQSDLVPVGMAIGPFSLMTKLLSDPITAVYLAGSGLSPQDEPDVALVQAILELSVDVVIQWVSAQARAGAKAVFVCEPAANKVYISPNQIDAGSDVFERHAMAPNRRLRAALDDLGMDLLFHCCGELTDDMVAAFGTLDPAILSLGASRQLWTDAARVPATTVLYGNLPSKRFFSDELSEARVIDQSQQLRRRMAQAAHPFILGTECDVLSVPGAEAKITAKVQAMMNS